MSNLKIILFDVDGVLVNPLAYREAIFETVCYFTKEFGIDMENVSPTEDEVKKFEAEGVHDVWDISAMCIAEIWHLMDKRAFEGKVFRPNYFELVEQCKDGIARREHPPEVLSRELEKEYHGNLPPEIRRLLEGTRDITNPVTRIFQEIVLGKDYFENTYSLPSQTKYQEPLLTLKDEPLLSPSTREKIIDWSKQKSCFVAIYTGRPGLPPKDSEDQKGFSPEAELALKLVGLESLPLVSMGMMEWLASEKHTSTEALTKPNPHQAIAAIFAALESGVTTETLCDAFQYIEEGNLPPKFDYLKDYSLEITVVEDSPSGVRAVETASNLLKQSQIETSLEMWGITGESEDKVEGFNKLSQEGLKVGIHGDINEAMNSWSIILEGSSLPSREFKN